MALWKPVISGIWWLKLGTLWAPLLYQRVELELLYFTHALYKVCRCATSRFQFDRPKNVEIMALWKPVISWIWWLKLGTLWAPLLYQRVELELLYFTHTLYKVCRCATSRFHFDRTQIDRLLKIGKKWKNIHTFPWAGNRHFDMKGSI